MLNAGAVNIWLLMLGIMELIIIEDPGFPHQNPLSSSYLLRFMRWLSPLGRNYWSMKCCKYVWGLFIQMRPPAYAKGKPRLSSTVEKWAKWAKPYKSLHCAFVTIKIHLAYLKHYNLKGSKNSCLWKCITKAACLASLYLWYDVYH